MPLNAGAGQGTILGLFFFTVIFNEAGPAAHQEPIGRTITQPLNHRKPMPPGKKKWVDDMTVTVPIRLQESLEEDTRPDIPRPVPYHGRTGHMLPLEKNQMQEEINQINEHCTTNKMSINTEKSKALLYNRSNNYDFMPELQLKTGSNQEIVEEIKLVGYQFRSDLKTISNTKYIVKRAYAKMWIVRRLKALGAGTSELLDSLRSHVISVLQFASPAWTTMLTKHEENRIENVLRTGLHLVYGDRYQSYTWALKTAGMKSLKEQRNQSFEKFTKGCLKSQKFCKWFEPEGERRIHTRQKREAFKSVPARTRAYEQSAIPQMTIVANKMARRKESQIIKLNSGSTIEV
jgi:hypothetical protein